MCTIPSPPPLPRSPPSPTSSNGTPSPRTLSEQFPASINQKSGKDIDSDICAWTSDHDLRIACMFAPICTKQPPFQMKYTNFDPLIQVGPTCGLVALSMLIHRKIIPDEILKISRSEGYTNNGEMFSCSDMARLAEKVYNLARIEGISVTVQSRSLFSPETVDSLLNGAFLLVPYDAEKDYRPSLKNGHSAHWALICGVMLINKPRAPYTIEKENIYVLSRHGKSKHLSAWNLAELAQSNNNLWEFSPRKQNDGLVYILPEGGIGGKNGLRGQFLTVQCNFDIWRSKLAEAAISLLDSSINNQVGTGTQ